MVCSLCRSPHPTEEKAIKCLNTCWDQVLKLPPVIYSESTKGPKFKCRFCSRLHQTKQEAFDCATDCVTAKNALHQRDLGYYEQPLRDFKRHKLTFSTHRSQVAVQHISRFQLKRNASSQSGEDHESAGVYMPDEQSPQVVSDEVTQLAKDEIQTDDLKETQPVNRRHRSEFGKGSWRRNEAKYECNYCHDLYFTKIEVEKCFNAHFDEEGREILDPEGFDSASAKQAA